MSILCKTKRIRTSTELSQKCYAHQLHRKSGLALTPIQKAFNRLEKGNVIIGTKDGKKRIYQFNSDYTLIEELEFLSKKAYNQLSPSARKLYHLTRDIKINDRKQSHELLQLIWNQLKNVSHMALIASSCFKRTGKWQQKGSGTVNVTHDANVITFHEKGTWKSNEGQSFNYNNTYRWTWNWRDEMISLEHLRLGENHPVFLFFLQPTEQNILESLNPHLCGADSYFGWMQYNRLFLQMNIRTIGPKKNEKIECIYT